MYLLNQQVVPDNEKTEEEKAYLKKVHECDVMALSGNWHEPMGHSLSSKNLLNVYDRDWQLEFYVSMTDLIRPKKKAKKYNLSTITLGYLCSKQGSYKVKKKNLIWHRMWCNLDPPFPSGMAQREGW